MDHSVRVRAITGGASFHELAPSQWPSFSHMFNSVEQNLQQYGLHVQTRRLALEPVHGIFSPCFNTRLCDFMRKPFRDPLVLPAPVRRTGMGHGRS